MINTETLLFHENFGQWKHTKMSDPIDTYNDSIWLPSNRIHEFQFEHYIMIFYENDHIYHEHGIDTYGAIYRKDYNSRILPIIEKQYD